MGTAFAWAVHYIWVYSDPLICYVFLRRFLVLLLPLIPYFVHCVTGRALIFLWRRYTVKLSTLIHSTADLMEMGMIFMGMGLQLMRMEWGRIIFFVGMGLMSTIYGVTLYPASNGGQQVMCGWLLCWTLWVTWDECNTLEVTTEYPRENGIA